MKPDFWGWGLSLWPLGPVIVDIEDADIAALRAAPGREHLREVLAHGGHRRARADLWTAESIKHICSS